MYLPPAFAETDPSTLSAFVRRHSFGLLVSQLGGEPFATHLPFLLDSAAGPHGTLVGHVARANPHWQYLDGQPALAVLSGPHAYVSPSWYAAENVVPTWNYTAVHAYGRVTLVHDPEPLLEIVRDTVAYYEAGMPTPWAFDGGTQFAARLVTQIVGFRIAIERLEGKFKLSQNHPLERRERVAAALLARGDENAVGVADMMRRAMRGGA
ncbi:transcriptional regulator : Transcriptional regulator OS=Singulisphaera acidiphila (strain ATCC BAA-1392 / DSM 18658 / VKM B-2454 / MOB10) GN=Sinac_7182 PE=4 SV=1: FMN_bind_2 [Gemmataceae bacterium]|nr:transcriptional regulator : Transcriptional regulator OS=Singulisphaera acidiphila (strain ATCC BAA-1392 / DSM 18658 / VKM B-2454 / MOB10) GN=Sinac_7182 PE=4 SV=1: FMN_bind_2 [Gemmataceae bacterium]VTT99661.1 transcriptional regulator : Transcriptional regulator OS=Singulisphaera acidiphila (strain ATCC BAA-1392 / DSM 18658 / VKM B-2454 / MOB10) GN=Sinac_7182 PE=4 SV=1: FMN_bind_2 [Gemmataceae bacterium]